MVSGGKYCHVKWVNGTLDIRKCQGTWYHFFMNDTSGPNTRWILVQFWKWIIFNNHFQLQHLGASFSLVLGSSSTKLMLLWGYEVKLPLKDTIYIYFYQWKSFFPTISPRINKTTTLLNSLVIILSCKLSSLLQGIICKDWKIRVRYMNS